MFKNLFFFFYDLVDNLIHQERIVKFIDNKNVKIVVDIGAHKGESINLFCKNFRINNIYSFEPSPTNFDFLNLQFPRIEKKFNFILSQNKYIIIKIVVI